MQLLSTLISMAAAFLLAPRVESGECILPGSANVQARYVEILGLRGNPCWTILLIRLSGHAPAELRLTNIDLDSSLVAQLAFLGKTKSLKLKRCKAHLEQIVALVDCLPRLESLTIVGTPVPKGPIAFRTFNQLSFLEISSCKDMAKSVAGFASFPSVRRLVVSSASVGERDLGALLQLTPNAERLEVVMCEAAQGAFRATSTARLKSLVVVGTKISDEDMRCICSDAMRIMYLTLVDVPIADSAIPMLGRSKFGSILLVDCGVSEETAKHQVFAGKEVWIRNQGRPPSRAK